MPNSNSNPAVRLELLESREAPTSIQVFDERGVNLLGPAPGVGQDRPVLHGLTGAGVRVAQYEGGRVGVAKIGDKMIDPVVNKYVTAAAVFEVDQTPVRNDKAVSEDGFGGHATQVASIIIAAPFVVGSGGVSTVDGKSYSQGLAPQAQLHSASSSAGRYPDPV